MRALATGLTLLTLLVSSAALAKTQPPIAVMPFRNLNQDPELAWLSHGIAETMISDIRRRGGLAVVERDQIDKALSELAFQSNKAIDASSAATIGRIVGAKTIVVGGYQKAGAQVRITARFVTVESGVVQDTAKVTGSLTTVFRLQDQIVSRLLGLKPLPPPKRTGKPRRGAIVLPPENTKTLRAYKLYAQSLTTATDATRRERLQASLLIDPTFHYAMKDLERLEQRMRGYHQRALEALSARENELLKTLRDDAAKEYERSAAAFQLHIAYITNGYYRADLALGEEVYTGDWRLPGTAKASGLLWMIGSFDKLNRVDEALQAAEHYLQEFPTAPEKLGVEYQVRALIQRKIKMDKGRSRANAELERIDAELGKLTDKSHDVRRVSLEFQRCTALLDNLQYMRAIRACGDVAEKWRSHSDTNVKMFVHIARWNLAKSYSGAGEYKQADQTAKQLIADAPDFARQNYVEMQTRQWPRD